MRILLSLRLMLRLIKPFSRGISISWGLVSFFYHDNLRWRLKTSRRPSTFLEWELAFFESKIVTLNRVKIITIFFGFFYFLNGYGTNLNLWNVILAMTFRSHIFGWRLGLITNSITVFITFEQLTMLLLLIRLVE